MARKFRVGDVVKLNSGGPNCTVIEYPFTSSPHDNYIEVAWVDNLIDSQTRTMRFPQECFSKVKEG